MPTPFSRPADAPPDHWIYRLPRGVLPYAQLARLDRPIGSWLLFWPCAWGVAFASAGMGQYPSAGLLALFALGAVVMRGAGCTYNDIVDRDLDARVPRTAGRPLAAGQVSAGGAWLFLVAQSLIGLAVLVQFNVATVIFGLASLLPVAIYPFMKRVTWWPQLFLGVAFNWGALLGFTAVAGGLSWGAVALYGAGVFWTLGYDTIYAHQDREDDALIGVKSMCATLGGRDASSGGIVLCFGVRGLGTDGLAGGDRRFVLGGVGFFGDSYLATNCDAGY